MNTLERWRDKAVVITGGSSGLGLALAQLLHAQGARVAIVARTAERIESALAANPGMHGFRADVADKQAIVPLAAAIHARLGNVHLLVNVASTLGPTPLRLLVDTDCEDFEQVLQTNLLGPFRLTKALLPSMMLGSGGTVVNISSDAAVHAYSTWGAYSVSKAALDHLSRIFAEELKAQGIRFLAIDPGDMNTPMHHAAVPDADPRQLKDPARAAQQLLATLEQDHITVRRQL